MKALVSFAVLAFAVLSGSAFAEVRVIRGLDQQTAGQQDRGTRDDPRVRVIRGLSESKGFEPATDAAARQLIQRAPRDPVPFVHFVRPRFDRHGHQSLIRVHRAGGFSKGRIRVHRAGFPHGQFRPRIVTTAIPNATIGIVSFQTHPRRGSRPFTSRDSMVPIPLLP